MTLRSFGWRTLLCCTLAFCLSCSRQLIEKDYEVGTAPGSFESGVFDGYGIDPHSLYRIMPGDVLEVMFHFQSDTAVPYVIEARDIVAVKFVDTPELNEQQQVRPDGRISLPYVGAVKIVDMTPEAIEAMLRSRYSAFLRDPEIYVVVVEYGGEVNLLKESIRNSAYGQSKLVTVRSDGFLTLPFVGEVPAAGKTIPEMTAAANTGYRRVSANLQVDLLLQQARGARICVLGQVDNPGFYQVSGPVNILQAIAMGGGFTRDANRSSVLAIQRSAGKIRYRLIDVEKGFGGDPESVTTIVQANDVIYVPGTAIANAAKVAADIANIFLFRGWGFSFGYDLNEPRF